MSKLGDDSLNQRGVRWGGSSRSSLALERAGLGHQRERLLAMIALGGLACAVGLLSLGLALHFRGTAAMERSDAAFHSGDLRASVEWAQTAALAYLPGAQHVRAAEERLEAVARGAESASDIELARRAWDSLRLVDEQTKYPGRGESRSGDTARRALVRIWKQVAEHGPTTEIR